MGVYITSKLNDRGHRPVFGRKKGGHPAHTRQHDSFFAGRACERTQAAAPTTGFLFFWAKWRRELNNQPRGRGRVSIRQSARGRGKETKRSRNRPGGRVERRGVAPIEGPRPRAHPCHQVKFSGAGRESSRAAESRGSDRAGKEAREARPSASDDGGARGDVSARLAADPGTPSDPPTPAESCICIPFQRTHPRASLHIPSSASASCSFLYVLPRSTYPCRTEQKKYC